MQTAPGASDGAGARDRRRLWLLQRVAAGVDSRAMSGSSDDSSPWDDDALSAAQLSVNDDPTWTAPTQPQASSSSVFETREDLRYRVGALVGAGGMGRVHQVYDRRLDRTVAVKTLAVESPALAERLTREARITATLDHPSIISVFNAGVDDAGRPFYSMPLLRGRSFDRVLAGADGLQARLRLLRSLLAVCEAMAYAHSRGVIHRDLKPANIVLGEFGETQVVDWGLARRLDNAEAGPLDGRPSGPTESGATPDLTRAGAIIGTPRYMSPEQAAAEPATKASDVWSLGLILYEIVSGVPALDGSSESALARLRKGTPLIPLASSAPNAPRELIAIVERATATVASDRYADAGELANDLQAYLDGRLVGAHDYSLGDSLRRFWRRYWLPSMVLVVGLIGTIAALTWGITEAGAERDRALRSQAEAQASAERALEAEATSRVQLAASLVRRATTALHRRDDADAMVLAARSRQYHDTAGARGVLAALGGRGQPRLVARTPLPSDCSNPSLDPTATFVLCSSRSMYTTYRLDAPDALLWRTSGNGCVFVAGGREVACSKKDARLEVLRTTDGEVVDALGTDQGVWLQVESQGSRWLVSRNLTSSFVWDRQVGDIHQTVSKSGDDATAALVMGDGDDAFFECTQDGWVHRVETSTREQPDTLPLGRLPTTGGVWTLDTTRDERLLVAADGFGDVALMQIDPWSVVHHEQTELGSIREARFSPSDALVGLAGHKGGIELRHGRSGRLVARLPRSAGRSIRWLAADTFVTTTASEALTWRIEGEPAPRIYPQATGLADVSISNDGARLAAANGSGWINVDSIASGARVATLDSHSGRVLKTVLFSRDGQSIISVAAAHTEGLFVWSAQPPFARTTLGDFARTAGLADVVELSDGTLVLRTYGTQVLHADLDRQHINSIITPFVRGICGTGRGQTVHLITDQGRADLDLTTAELTPREPIDGAAGCAMSADGERTALRLSDTIVVVDADDTIVVNMTLPTGSRLTSLTWLQDDRLVAAGTRAGDVLVFAGDDGRLIGRVQVATEQISSIAEGRGPSAGVLFASSWDKNVYRLELETLFESPEQSYERALGFGLAIDVPAP